MPVLRVNQLLPLTLGAGAKPQLLELIADHAGRDAELASGARGTNLTQISRGPNQVLWELDCLRFSRLAQYLRFRHPDATIGYSIMIFRLSAEEVRVAIDGTSDELADMIGRVVKAR